MTFNIKLTDTSKIFEQLLLTGKVENNLFPEFKTDELNVPAEFVLGWGDTAVGMNEVRASPSLTMAHDAKMRAFRRIAKMTGMRGVLKRKDVFRYLPKSSTSINMLFRNNMAGLRQLIGQMGLKPV